MVQRGHGRRRGHHGGRRRDGRPRNNLLLLVVAHPLAAVVVLAVVPEEIQISNIKSANKISVGKFGVEPKKYKSKKYSKPTWACCCERA